jgi:uncharacterized membrane protein YjjB (DUF3815 family)
MSLKKHCINVLICIFTIIIILLPALARYAALVDTNEHTYCTILQSSSVNFCRFNSENTCFVFLNWSSWPSLKYKEKRDT